MKVIILAAGYATRLYPLTLTQAKPLLPVAGVPMIERVLSSLEPIKGIDQVFVVTNQKFAGNFEAWSKLYREKGKFKIKIINDGSTDNSDRLGAIGDLHLVLKNEKLDDDLLVVAGDNLFSENLSGFAKAISNRQTPVLGVYDIGSFEEAKKLSLVSVDKDGQITKFEEKPANPSSTLVGIALYFYPQASLSFIDQYLAEKNNPDQPGRLIEWLYTRLKVGTWVVPGTWFDIGSKETLEEANRIFGKK